MRTFAAVAAAGRFQAAADELGVTQQAASKRVAGLERQLGVRLFVRTAGGCAADRGRAGVPAARPGTAPRGRARADGGHSRAAGRCGSTC
ncbi:helix-turn-helix domain-containing protein [Amycolatopsis methanolica]|uniref:helix-turn-helix domain-containing protein n=1 Tax=Amycolatopsis methanolica TaxID=1814 RepID=UPI001CC25CFA|nr:LysR family transcriptional regulator [Amycolatopsis methanolica]